MPMMVQYRCRPTGVGEVRRFGLAHEVAVPIVKIMANVVRQHLVGHAETRSTP
jgi:hypothetical protein